jgi:hypothetical protein
MTALVVVGVIMLAWVAITAGVLHRLRRNNSVSHRGGGRAPLSWLVSTGTCAHLHRRLRRAVAAVRVVVPPPRRRGPRGAFHDIADDLEREAVAIDAELVAARRLPLVHRRAAQRLVAPRVTEIELLAARVVSTGPSVGHTLSLDGLRDRIDALHEAHIELDRLERSVGLHATG